jgi:periplasmic protein TonB
LKQSVIDFSRQQRNPAKHLGGIAFVIFLHVAIVYALLNGNRRDVVLAIQAPLEVNIIKEQKVLPPELPSPPPPPARKITPTKPTVARPAFVPSPDVRPQTPAEPVRPPITTTNAPPPEAPPVAVPEPAPTIVRPPSNNVAIVCPNIESVKSEIRFPPQALREGLSGEVLIEFIVAPSGQVQDAKVVQSTHRLFNNVALNAVRRLECIGTGQAIRVQAPFAFNLKE